MINPILDNFLAAIQRCRNRRELVKLLKAILTPKEYVDIPKRLEILRLLKSNTPQSKIVENLEVARATVTRGSNVVKDMRENYADDDSEDEKALQEELKAEYEQMGEKKRADAVHVKEITFDLKRTPKWWKEL